MGISTSVQQWNGVWPSEFKYRFKYYTWTENLQRRILAILSYYKEEPIIYRIKPHDSHPSAPPWYLRQIEHVDSRINPIYDVLLYNNAQIIANSLSVHFKYLLQIDEILRLPSPRLALLQCWSFHLARIREFI